MADGKAPRLLPGQAEMAEGKGLLLCRQPPGLRTPGERRVSRWERAAGWRTPPAPSADSLAVLTSKLSRRPGNAISAATPEASHAPSPLLGDLPLIAPGEGPRGSRLRGMRGAPPAVRARWSGCKPSHGAMACAIGYSGRSALSIRPGRSSPWSTSRAAGNVSTTTGCANHGWWRTRASSAPVVSDQCISFGAQAGAMEGLWRRCWLIQPPSWRPTSSSRRKTCS
jgi:hypothetical protein